MNSVYLPHRYNNLDLTGTCSVCFVACSMQTCEPMPRKILFLDTKHKYLSVTKMLLYGCRNS